ncbi:MAG: ABC transporter substrate-binding protein [Candidatus Bathyarchaeia archaeon]
MSNPGSSKLIALLIIGLVIGAGAGYVLGGQPFAGWYSPEEYQTAAAAEIAAAAAAAAVAAEAARTAMIGAGFESPVTSSITGTVKLGGLFCFTGALATFGENEFEAAQLAVTHVNAFLDAAGYSWDLAIEAEDTALGAGGDALEALESLYARGIKLIIGPLASSEVRAIKGYCDQEKILAISQSSTAPDLGIAGDYIYRFCPSDKNGQGPALGRILAISGIKYVIPVTRNDAWGTGLEAAVKLRFESLGGTFLEGILYADIATEFSLEASDLATKVSNAIALYGTDEVAVLHISFEEVTAFFTAAAAYDILDDIKWFGSDGTAQSGAMTENPTVAAFAAAVDYPCTIFAPAKSAKFEMVRQNGQTVLGRDPDSYSYSVYDIVWCYALSICMGDSIDVTDVRDNMLAPGVLTNYFGASGSIDLDANGDRKAGDYFIWEITEADGEYSWTLAGTWILSTDTVIWE